MARVPRSETRQLNLDISVEVHQRLMAAAQNRKVAATELIERSILNLNPNYRPVEVESIANRRPRKSGNRFDRVAQRLIIQEKLGGLTIYEIARLWNCNKSTIARIVNREEGYKAQIHVIELPLTVAECDELRSLRNGNPERWSFGKLGKRFKVSHVTAYRVFNQQGVYARYGQQK